MARKYIVKATKYGRDWKKIWEGINFLEDNKKYRLEFHADGLIKAIRAKIAFKQNKRFRYYTYWEKIESNTKDSFFFALDTASIMKTNIYSRRNYVCFIVLRLMQDLEKMRSF